MVVELTESNTLTLVCKKYSIDADRSKQLRTSTVHKNWTYRTEIVVRFKLFNNTLYVVRIFTAPNLGLDKMRVFLLATCR
jgi:hypothetical protein